MGEHQRFDDSNFPMRDLTHKRKSVSKEVDPTKKIAATKANIENWPLDEIQDKYLRIYEENIILKKHARMQEEKIKQLETKLTKLKKQFSDTGSTKIKGRDIKSEEIIDDLHTKIHELQKLNSTLKEKLMIAKQQLNMQPKRNTSYTHIQSRIHTGLERGDKMAKSMRIIEPQISKEKFPRFGHSLLEESRAEINRLERTIEELNEQLNMKDQELEQERERYRIREMEFEEDLGKMKTHMSEGQRVTIQENIDIIRLQREVKEKSTSFISLQAKYANIEEQFRMATAAREKLIDELEAMGVKVRAEQNRNSALEADLKDSMASQRRIVELQERIKDLESECLILKESNEKLVNSAFDMEREKEWRSREKALKVQIAQLEATLKSDVGEKGSILDKLTEERDRKEKMEEDHKDLRIKYFNLKQEHDEMIEKMKFFNRDSAVDMQEIEEALVLVKQRKERESNTDVAFLKKVDDEMHIDMQKSFDELQADHADTINELEKTRNMLIVQHKINNDYRQESMASVNKLEEMRTDYETRLEEYAQLLDIRAIRIKKLEAQLRDVAYGTRQYKIKSQDKEGEDGMDIDEEIQLNRDENMFEFHIKRVVLTPEAVNALEDEEASLFCTYDFYEFETQATPVLRAPKPEFEFTSQYVIKADNFLIHYLQREHMIIELHRSRGTDYETVATATIKLIDLLERENDGKLHKNISLTSNFTDVVNVGTLEFWMRLRVPMEQAYRLYKEKAKALGYIESNMDSKSKAIQCMDETAAERNLQGNVNVLIIRIKCASKIKARSSNVQPSSYVIYKFFDFPEHDTQIINSSNNPIYNDTRSFPITMTADLDNYLKKAKLSCYVFDDSDPDEMEYLGLAVIPLIPLSLNKNISGIFELVQKDGSVNGSLDVSLKWRQNYIAPTGIMTSKQTIDENLTLLEGEKDELRHKQENDLKKISIEKQLANEIKHTSIVPELIKTDSEPSIHHKSQIKNSNEFQSKDRISIDSVHQSLITTSIQEESEPDTERSEKLTPKPVRRINKPTIKVDDEDNKSYDTDNNDDDRNSFESEGYVPPKKQKLLEEKLEQGIVDDIEGDIEKNKNGNQTNGDEIERNPNIDPYPINTVTNTENDEKSSIHSQHSRNSTLVDEESESDGSQVIYSQRANSADIGEIVTISVGELMFNDDADILTNNEISNIYVAYNFLGIDPQETETPYSLPKPAKGKTISFNFEKNFNVDFQTNYLRRQYLAGCLNPNDADAGRIRFAIISEPQDDDCDCEDIGVAIVSVADILKNERDIIEELIPILDYTDEMTEIGQLKITVKCLQVLKIIQSEIAVVN